MLRGRARAGLLDPELSRTNIADVVIIEPEPRHDGRRFFLPTFCADAFEQQGLDASAAQRSLAYNTSGGTLGGLRFQEEPYGEAKLVRCIRGAAGAVDVDLRRGFTTYRRHIRSSGMRRIAARCMFPRARDGLPAPGR